MFYILMDSWLGCSISMGAAIFAYIGVVSGANGGIIYLGYCILGVFGILKTIHTAFSALF